MKMAKASEADLNMALKLCSALEAVERRFFPEGSEGDSDPEDFDLNDDEQCGRVLRHLHQVLNGGSIGRVIWGMYVLLDPENKLVDPAADTIEHHPSRAAMLEALQASRACIWTDRMDLADAHTSSDGIDEDGAAGVAEYDEVIAQIDAAIAAATAQAGEVSHG